MREELQGCLSVFKEIQTRCQGSRKLILVIVAIALLLDNMLLTSIVPIFPTYLYYLNHPNASYEEDYTEVQVDLSSPSSSIHPHPDHLSTTTPATAILEMDWRARPPELDGAFAVRPSGEGCYCPCLANGDPIPTRSSSGIGKDASQGRGGIHSNRELGYLYDNLDEDKAHPPDQGDKAATTNKTAVVTVTRRRRVHGINHEDLKKENIPLGIMYSAKALMQLLTNPIIGPLTYRIGYSIPMFAGFVIMFVSTLIFAFGNSYIVLFIARALQGVGSSCSSVSGMGMLAECYPDDKERGNAMGLALGGLALGVLIGPTFGGIMYEYFNKTAPFLVLAFLALGDGLLQLLVLKPMVRPQEKKAPTLTELIQDPYIIVAAGAITFANMGIGILEPSLPIWMMDRMNSTKLEQGTIFLPASISYLVGTNLFGPLGHLMGRSMAAFIGLILSGISMIFIPFATSQRHLILPTAGLGFAIGMVDSSMMPELGNLVDLRHSNVYGSVYSIGDVAFCLGFFIGPVLSGTLIEHIGFDAMMYGIAIINFMYAPLLYFLKNVPPKCEERTNLIEEQKAMSYVNFKNSDEEE